MESTPSTSEEGYTSSTNEFRAWSTPLTPYTSVCPSTLALSDERVFVATNGSLLAFSSSTGRLLWRRNELVSSKYETISTPSTASAASVEFLAERRRLDRWEFHQGLVFTSGENCLHALSERDGSTIWTYCSPKVTASLGFQPSIDESLGVVVTAALIGGDRSDFEDSGARLLAFDMLTGGLLWEAVILESHLRESGDRWIDMYTPGISIHPVSERVYSSWVFISARTNEELMVVASHDLRTGKTMYEYVTRSSDFDGAAENRDSLVTRIGIPSVDLQGFAYVSTTQGVLSLDGQGALRWRFTSTKSIQVKSIPTLSPESTLDDGSSSDEGEPLPDTDPSVFVVEEETGFFDASSGKKRKIVVDGSPLMTHPPVLNEQDQVAYIPTLSKEIYTVDLRDGGLLSLPTRFDPLIVNGDVFGSELQTLAYHPSGRKLVAGGKSIQIFALDRDGLLSTLEKKIDFRRKPSKSTGLGSLSEASSSSSSSEEITTSRAPLVMDDVSLFYISHSLDLHSPGISSSPLASKQKGCRLEGISSTTGLPPKKKRRIG